MYFLLPFVAAFLDAISLIVSKAFLRRYGRLTYKEYNWVTFLGILIVLLISAQLFNQFPNWATISAHWLPLLALGLLGTLSNVFFSKGLEEERVSNLEPFIVFRPLVGILIASFIFPEERSLVIYVGILLAASILAWANLKREHLRLNRALVFIMLHWFSTAFEVVLTTYLLGFFPPIALYILRCVIIFVALSLFSKPNLQLLQPQHLPPALFMGILAVFSVVATYIALYRIGIAPTLFAQVLSPALVYWFSASVLHDRWNRKNVFATILIVLLVVTISWWLA